MDTFVKQFIPQIKKQATKNKELIDAIDAAIAMAMRGKANTKQNGGEVEQTYTSPTAFQNDFIGI